MLQVWLSASVGSYSQLGTNSLLTLASYHIFIFIAFIVSLPSGGITILYSELHHAAECAGHCEKERLW